MYWEKWPGVMSRNMEIMLVTMAGAFLSTRLRVATH
jgi:hypothetical protein